MSDRDRVDMSTCHWFLLLVVVMHPKLLGLSDIDVMIIIQFGVIVIQGGRMIVVMINNDDDDDD